MKKSRKNQNSAIYDEVLEAVEWAGFTCEPEDLDTKLDGNITEHYLNQVPKFLFWSTVRAKGRVKRDKIKSELEAQTQYLKTVLKSELYGKMKTQLELEGEKITEAKIEASIYSSKEYQKAVGEINNVQELLDEANGYYFVLESVATAWEMRKDMLMGLGAYKRLEVGRHLSEDEYEED